MASLFLVNLGIRRSFVNLKWQLVAMLGQKSKLLLTNLLKAQLFLRLFLVSVFLFTTNSHSFAQARQLQNAIVIDPLSGVAINGYDPVSYFISDEPEQGLPEYEYIWYGVPWLFSSEANRDVFAISPEVYSPRFGGHGAMGLARGYLSDGNPHVFAILGKRLFLFYSSANRDAFMLAQRASYIKAQKNWEFFTASVNNLQK